MGPLPKKAQGLLAYLVVHSGRPIPREQLADLLWSHSGNEQARRSLRDCLMSLKSALGSDGAKCLANEGASVCFNALSNTFVDVLQFNILSCSRTLAELEAASVLYRDEFLCGLQVRSEPFVDWVGVERRRLTARMSDVMYQLAVARAQAGNTDRAIEAAERLTAFDSLREDGHRLLMQLLAKAGRRTAALKQYTRCADILHHELGVGPELATSRLATALRESAESHSLDDGSKRKNEAQLHHSTMVAAFSDKTSIAVLPFVNLSAGVDQDDFGDGVAEEITMALGRVPWLFVIGSGSAMANRCSALEVRQIGAELGVRYVLRGSIRKGQGRLRVVVQLVNAADGSHVWAERFEGGLHEVFSIQDRVAAQASAMIAPALQSVEIEHSQHKSTVNPDAYDLYLRALPQFRTTFEANKQAIVFLQRAIELNPHYGAAYGLAARCYQFQRLFGWVNPSDPSLQEGVRLSYSAAEIGKNDSDALWMAGIALAQLAGEVEHGLALIEKSLVLNPNSASAWISSAFVLGEIGDAEKALKHFYQAQRLNPLDSMHHIQWLAAGFAHMSAGRHREAAEAVDKTLKARPTYTPAMRLKVSLSGLLERKTEGDEWVRRLLVVNPDASVSWFRIFWAAPLRHHPDLLERMLEGARRAGLPESAAF
jgi:TolB-like protein